MQKCWRADRVWFADAPFSSLEAAVLLEYLDCGQPPGEVLFTPAALTANHSFLNTLYPEGEVIGMVWPQLQKAPRGGLRGEAAHICQVLSDKTGRGIAGAEFISILRILEELDLCRVQKKGSIIAVKLLERNNLPENLSDSSFYMEGQAEKAALANFEEDVKSALDW